MNYENPRLNISVSYCEDDCVIEEYSNYVELYAKEEMHTKKRLLLSIFPYSRIVADGRYVFLAYDNSKVTAHDTSTVHAYNWSNIRAEDSSHIYAYDKANVYAYDESNVSAYQNAYVEAREASTVCVNEARDVVAYDNAKVSAYKDSVVKMFGTSSAHAYGRSKILAYGKSEVFACNESTVEAYGNSIVHASHHTVIKAYQDAFVYAHDFSIVHAYDKVKVEAHYRSDINAYDFSSIYVNSPLSKISNTNHFGTVITQVHKVTKKMLVYKKLYGGKVATLQLEKGQVFQSENYYKCRTDRALVISIESVDGRTQYESGVSMFDSNFKYVVGQMVSSDYDKRIEECGRGIHFFLRRDLAEMY